MSISARAIIGLEAFRRVLNDPRFAGMPMCLETPKGPDFKEDLENLATLRSLFKLREFSTDAEANSHRRPAHRPSCIWAITSDRCRTASGCRTNTTPTS